MRAVTAAYLFSFWCYTLGETLYSHLWAVHVEGGERVARSVAERNGFKYVEKVMDDIYHFTHHTVQRRSSSRSTHHHSLLIQDPAVLWLEQQEIKSRVKRDLPFNDEKFGHQWYLHKNVLRNRNGVDMNVQGAWNKGYSGKGVVVTILDDGIERTHPDLSQNYDPKASWDINGQDSDPSPRYDFTDENRHGTRCAGEVAAVANNSVCGVGVAYDASIGGIRMLDGDVTDSVEAMSLSLNRDHIDIYSASWGPDDDGKTVDGPAVLARRAFRDGVHQGRSGLGSIFVWASGNGGRDYDNCNCDGYTNSIYTLSVSSATENGNIPWYSEACSSTLVSTYSSGDRKERQITTTDLRRGCTNLHTGTSASAPLAAGIVALTLQAKYGCECNYGTRAFPDEVIRPSLTWRDVQYISVLAASSKSLHANDWVVNGAGKNVSHHFGFGMMDAGRMVDLAGNWTNLPAQHICQVASPKRNILIPPQQTRRISVITAGCRGTDNDVQYLEHVQARITLSSSWRGDIQMWLISPSGTRSTLLTRRGNDDSEMGFNEWAFLTTHSWGERSVGEWVLEISNGYRAENSAILKDWVLVLHGTAEKPRLHNQPTQQTSGVRRPSTTPEPTKEASTYPATSPSSRPSIDEPVILNRTFTPRPQTSPSTTITLTDKEEKEESSNMISIDSNVNVDKNGELDIWSSHSSLDSQMPISNSINSHTGTSVKCPSGTFYVEDQCHEKCPSGYYPETQPPARHVCLPCHDSCVNCLGKYNYSCSDCYSGSVLVDGRCLSTAAKHVPRMGASSYAEESALTVIIGATSALGVLLVILITLVIWYVYSQHKARHRRPANPGRAKSRTPNEPTFNSVVHEHLTSSKHSSQQELMDSDEESSSNGSNKSGNGSVDYPPCLVHQV